MKYFIEIVKFPDNGAASQADEIIKRYGPMSIYKAERVDTGLQIILNHDLYYTRTVCED